MPVRAKSINWTREELILALNLYFEVGNAGPTNRRVIELAQLFQQLGFSRDEHGNVAARTDDSVAMKLGNFRHLDPSHPKVGLNKSTTKDEVVWNEFAGNRDRLALAVADLLARSVNPLGPQPVLARRVALEAYNTYDMSPAPATSHHLAVLLPSGPPGNAIDFLRSLSIRLIYPGSGSWPVDS